MNKLTPPVSKLDNQVIGPDFKITLVEFGDYQCPYCGMAYPIVKRLVEERGDQMRFVFRNFPLHTVHPYAITAALTAEAASLQNRFWEMHNLLFENQERFTEAMFLKLAGRLKLDLYQFQKDYSGETTKTKVNDDFKSGLMSGVNRTPTFFIDGEKIDLKALTYEALVNVVDERLVIDNLR